MSCAQVTCEHSVRACVRACVVQGSVYIFFPNMSNNICEWTLKEKWKYNVYTVIHLGLSISLHWCTEKIDEWSKKGCSNSVIFHEIWCPWMFAHSLNDPHNITCEANSKHWTVIVYIGSFFNNKFVNLIIQEICYLKKNY